MSYQSRVVSATSIVDARHPDAITGPEMDALSQNELQSVVMSHNVFARASPENKIFTPLEENAR